eukprot:s822_g3.t2
MPSVGGFFALQLIYHAWWQALRKEVLTWLFSWRTDWPRPLGPARTSAFVFGEEDVSFSSSIRFDVATVAPATSSEHARVPPGGLDSGEPAAGITAEADVMETVRLESPSRTASARAYGMVLAMTLAAQDAPGAVEGPAADEPRDYSRSPPRTVRDAFGTFERKIASDRAALSWLQNRVVQLQSEMEQLRRLMDAAQRGPPIPRQ